MAAVIPRKVVSLSLPKTANSISSERRYRVLSAPGALAATAAGSLNAPSGRVAEAQPLGRAPKLQGEERSPSIVSDSAAPWTVARQAPLAMGFPRQEYWSPLPFPSPRDLPDPGIEPGSPAWRADALPSEPPAGCPWNVSGLDPGRGPVVEKGTARVAETPESLLGGLSQSWHPARTTRPGRATWAAEETRPSGSTKRLAGRLPPRRCTRLAPGGAAHTQPRDAAWSLLTGLSGL